MQDDLHANAGAPQPLSIWSLRDLEHRLGFDRKALKAAAGRSGAGYKPFYSSPKPRPFARRIAPPKTRKIDNPLGLLKEIQSRINRRLLGPLSLPGYMFGGIKGRSILDNVAIHVGSRFLVTLDIKSFFPSISNQDIYRVWSQQLGCSPAISGLLTTLTTFERRLPQGAPTSTLLANLVLHAMDEEIRTECARNNVTYSNWVDDLAFSGDDATVVIPGAIRVLRRNGFRIARKKLRIMGPASRKVMNGLLANKFPSAPKDYIDQLRSGIHKLRIGAIQPAERERYESSLRGKILYVKWIYHRKGNKLLREFETAQLTAGNLPVAN